MPMKDSPENVMKAFNNLPSKPTRFQILEFLDQYFSYPGADIEVWTPEDWNQSPPLLSKIMDPTLQSWASQLNAIWKELGRKTGQSVFQNPERHSLLALNHGYIVPGGRFREFYYWDTYWIVNGLISCDMFTTVEGTLDNFVTMLNRFGFIPNGARVYYSERTQPPMFTQMVWDFYQASLVRNSTTQEQASVTGIDILKKYVGAMNQEYKFWMTQRAVQVKVNGTTYTLNHYNAHSNLPRPEGYTEDVNTAIEAGITDPYAPNQIYRNIASGAESGWDFSSRWFGNYENLTQVATTDLLPVDLNSILYKNEITLHKIYDILAANDTSDPTLSQNAQSYLNAAQARKTAIENVLWNEEAGYWVDYNVTDGSPRSTLPEYFYASSFCPLWADMYWDGLTTGKYTADHIQQAFLAAIQQIGVADFVGGVPTSMKETSQQWDFPNGWAPLQMFAIHGLRNLGTTGCETAAHIASAWLQNNYNGWVAAHQMFEKYDVTSTSGVPGNGGEYNVQSGFGWTNGAVFELLTKYCSNASCINSQGQIQVPVCPPSSSSEHSFWKAHRPRF